ncbi:MAG: glutamine synthetase family protein [Candidatus Dormibacteria bacterium]
MTAPRLRPSRATDSAVHDALEQCQRSGAAQVELQFADITGAVKSVSIPARRLEEVLREGEWFDGSAIQGSAREVESDMFLMPDADTFALIDPRAELVCARLICEVITPGGDPYAGDSRASLRTLVEATAAAGLAYMVAPEVEFFLFPAGDDGLHQLENDPSSYFERSGGHSRQVELEIVAALETMGVLVESSHQEVASGQYELDLPMLPALAAADALTTLKPAVKELARQRGLQASFMPKPLQNAAGSGMHTHQILLGPDGVNAFHAAGEPYEMSEVARRFAAGQIDHAPGMCAVIAPLVNSYKRLVPGYEAPSAGSWGRHNRSALIRVPAPARGAKAPRDLLGTRLELRLPDPSCNPYLAFAVMLAAGMDGLERELELGPPMEEVEHGWQGGARTTMLPLPGSLWEALERLDQDDVVADALGSEVLELFRSAKHLEWDGYRRQVTPWEIDTYLKSY